ncbi:MAG: HYR domain-containing protein, partial [Armatimonadota bacterium]
TLAVPADVTAEQTSRNGTSVNIGQATATDVCDVNPTITNDASEVFPLGTTTVTWTATDASGNKSTATQKVTVRDTTPPVIRGVTATPNSIWPVN